MLKFWKDPEIQQIQSPIFASKGVKVFVKREDQIHPFVSGNKWRKLKYNLRAAQDQNQNTLLTFGGAFSNHIYATAAAAREVGYKSIGIIRGEELKDKPLNATLSFANEQGMKLHFISREEYRQKMDAVLIENLKVLFGDFFIIPEGGTNIMAVKGCLEILNQDTQEFDYVCTSVGTGGTLMGLACSAKKHQQIIGFSSLKGGFLAPEIEEKLNEFELSPTSKWEINNDYHFGGYAKVNSELIHFIHKFEQETKILLDQVYTGKMMFGIYDMIKKDRFPSGSKILAIHTGGLQGRNLK